MSLGQEGRGEGWKVDIGERKERSEKKMERKERSEKRSIMRERDGGAKGGERSTWFNKGIREEEEGDGRGVVSVY